MIVSRCKPSDADCARVRLSIVVFALTNSGESTKILIDLFISVPVSCRGKARNIIQLL